MKRTSLTGTLALLTALVGCADNSPTTAPLSNAAAALVNADVATVSSDVVGQDVEVMRGPGGIFAFGMAAERGKFECTSAARDGLTATRTCVYKDAAGNTTPEAFRLITAVRINSLTLKSVQPSSDRKSVV